MGYNRRGNVNDWNSASQLTFILNVRASRRLISVAHGGDLGERRIFSEDVLPYTKIWQRTNRAHRHVWSRLSSQGSTKTNVNQRYDWNLCSGYQRYSKAILAWTTIYIRVSIDTYGGWSWKLIIQCPRDIGIVNPSNIISSTIRAARQGTW